MQDWCVIQEQKNNNKVPKTIPHCLKQKGIVKTLTPTMLFTTFMIKPQFDAVILARFEADFSKVQMDVDVVFPHWSKV